MWECLFFGGLPWQFPASRAVLRAINPACGALSPLERLMKTFFPLGAFVVGWLFLTGSVRAIPNTTSFAKATFTSSVAFSSTTNYNCSTSAYTLGKNIVDITGATLTTVGPVTEFYITPVTIMAEKTSDGTNGLALSAMVTEGSEFNCYYPYKMLTHAKVTLDGVSGFFFGPAGIAKAIANDPQVFAFPGGVSATDYGLDAGSALFAVRPGMDFAHILFTLDVPFIPGELASIDLFNDGTGVHAMVMLSSEPGVSFFNPTTHLPITPTDVELAILSAPDLATEDGLTSPLSLFGVAFDLFGRPITPGDGLQSNLTSEASSAAGMPAIPGDYNGNRSVDAADYVLWRKDPASYGGDPAGFDTWRANFGAGPGSSSSSASVPEPAAVDLVLVGLLLCGVKRNSA